MNSPTKFEEPGIARFASVTIRDSVASTGARNAIPPMSASFSEPPERIAAAATMKNSGTVTSAWLAIWISAPWAPCGVSEKIPSTMKPSCATDE